jgi:16S rRNA (cytidine1402-2'-O)-methyltransferase
VATPIGNASDISLRALAVLQGVDAIIAEDTRVTSKLLALHGISRPLLSYNDHNASRERPKLLERLSVGAALALVSDAGTPLISDPGHKLVREARAAGIAVFAVPGASALLASLSIAGLPTDRFFFAGFLSSKSGERRQALEELNAIPATLVFFESPQRLKDALAEMAEIFGAREAAVARELTKLHEELLRGTLAELAAHYAAQPTPKGEITLVIAPPAEAAPANQARVDALLALALPHMPVKAAAELIAEATGHARRDIYARALKLKDNKNEK